MDFLDPHKNRQHAIRLMVGYVLVGIAIALGSVVLLLQTYGYDLDRQTGKVVQNGLVFVASHPVSAKLYLNGELKDTTSTKLTIASGVYTIALKQDGYRSWQKSFSLQGGTVKQLVYPVLFPTKLVTTDQQLYGTTPVFVTQSPDRRWLLVLRPGTLTTFDNFDLNDPANQPTNLTLPSGLLTASTTPDSLKLVEWSTDNRHILLQHIYSGGEEFVVVDRQEPASSYNINRDFSVNPSLVALHNKRFDQLYIYDSSSKTIQTADAKTKQIKPLLANVISFKPYGANTIVYATDDSETPGKNAIKIWDGKQSHLMHLYPAASAYNLDMAAYSGHTYVIVNPVGASVVYIYKDPLNEIKRTNKPVAALTSLKLNQTAYISFSANAQFIMAQSGSSFAVYDIESSSRYFYALKDQVPATQKAVWMDGNRIMIVMGGKTIVIDYDGINQQTLAESSQDILPYFSRDYTNLYNIAPSVQVPERSALTRTLLTVK